MSSPSGEHHALSPCHRRPRCARSRRVCGSRRPPSLRSQRERIGDGARAAAGEPADWQPDALSPRRAATATRCSRQTRVRETIRACRPRRSSRAAVRSRTIRRPDLRPPSASSAAGDTHRPCRGARNLRPALQQLEQIAWLLGSSIDGRRRAVDASQDVADSREALEELRVLLPRRSQKTRAMLRAARAVSVHRTSARPSGVGAHAAASGRMIRSPRCSSASVLTSAGSMARLWTIAGQRNPGAISDVARQPPTRSERSSTSGFSPLRNALASSCAAADTRRHEFVARITKIRRSRDRHAWAVRDLGLRDERGGRRFTASVRVS